MGDKEFESIVKAMKAHEEKTAVIATEVYVRKGGDLHRNIRFEPQFLLTFQFDGLLQTKLPVHTVHLTGIPHLLYSVLYFAATAV